MPINKLDYIQDKLSYIQSKINNDNKLQHYDSNKKAEDIFMHLLNLTHGWNLKNANDEVTNFTAIDLMDTTKNNKIVIQVTSDRKKTKVEKDTIEAFNKLVKEDKYKIYAHYEIKMFYIKDKPSKSTLKNWEDEGLISQSNILGIEDINKKISADTTHTLATKVFKYLCNLFHDKACESDISPQLTTKLGKSTLIGREKELQEIDEQLNSLNTLLLINGIGGLGKSNIASCYLHRHKEQFDYYGFFEGLESFTNELEKTFRLKSQLGDDNLLRVLVELRGLEGKKLLVIDDVKEIRKNQERIEQILALKDNGYKILLTSREQMEEIEAYTLGVLSLKDAKELFDSIFKIDNEVLLEEIVTYLDCHAFFVEMTAKSLKVNTQRTPEKIVEMFRNGELSKIKVNRNESFNDYLNEQFSLDSLDEEDILLLKQLSLLPSIEIDFKFLTIIFGLRDEGEIEDLQDLLNFLVQKGWLITNGKAYKLHRIIKEFIWANHQSTLEEMDKIVLFFANLIKNNDIQSAVLLKGYLVYFEAIDDVLNRIGIFNENITEFWEALGQVYNFNGLYNDAEPLLLKVVKLREKILGKKSPKTAYSYNGLALLYENIGDYPKAELFQLKALNLSKTLLGENHPATATSYNNLALLYKSMGKYNKSEQLYFNAIKISEKIVGINHLSTATCYNNLALLYESMKRYDESEELYLKAIRIIEGLLEENHLYISNSYHNLAKLYQLKKYDEKAIYFYFKALKIREKVLGENHPNRANSYHDLAVFYFEQENFEKAYMYIKKALNTRSKIFHKEHFDLISSKEVLEMIEEKL